ncbi:Ankyrin repeat-containing protein [Spatholobus suberectus]|nr:Ankyrin repeat-containing protein [Spatholobus suberectus]
MRPRTALLGLTSNIPAMELLEDPKLQDDTMRELYEASINGCTSTLNTLIQKDPLILSRVSLYPFTETPLHIASLLGHLEFCQALLQNSPSSAGEVDSEGRCPLHLASAKGHTEVVKALSRTNPEMCLVRDKDDMLPLHFAAMRGRVGAIEELIKAKPDSIREMTETDDGSVLHLCVRYNHLEALKFLVESLRGDHQFLSLKDKEDNTLLHLAVKCRQMKIIKYLLSLSEMSTEINALNRDSLTAMDMLERNPRHFMSQHILTKGVPKHANEVIAQAAVSSATLVSEQKTTPSTSRQQPTSSQSITIIIVQPDPPQASAPALTNNDLRQSSAPSLTNNDLPQPSLPSLSNNDSPQASATSLANNDPPQASAPNNNAQPAQPSPQQTPPPPSNTDPPPASQGNGPLHPETSPSITNAQHGQERWNRFERFCRTYLLDQGNWIDKKTREQLMVAATVIATMTFQSVISPPGGVWQGDTTQDGFTCPDYGFCEAGTAVVGYAWSPDFLKFVFFNSSSFFSSLCVMLVLMSGFPLENKVVMWILAVLMIVAASCMLLTYMWALGLVSPNHIYYRIRKLGYLLVGTWAMLLGLVCLVQTSRIVFWARSRLRRMSSTNVEYS